jgi:transcriptional regulator with XRE-family HTH domain
MAESPQSPNLFLWPGFEVKVLNGGRKIDFLREKEDLTYGELAAKSGVPEKTVERVCRGENAPGTGHFLRLLKALDVKNPLNIFSPGDFEGGV